MTKLLSEEELRNTLLLEILHDTNVSGRHIDALVDLIQSQKIAHGEMVIGGYLSDVEMPNYDRRQGHNRLVSAQRERNRI